MMRRTAPRLVSVFGWFQAEAPSAYAAEIGAKPPFANAGSPPARCRCVTSRFRPVAKGVTNSWCQPRCYAVRCSPGYVTRGYTVMFETIAAFALHSVGNRPQQRRRPTLHARQRYPNVGGGVFRFILPELQHP